jgi:hypothetical protein
MKLEVYTAGAGAIGGMLSIGFYIVNGKDTIYRTSYRIPHITIKDHDTPHLVSILEAIEYIKIHYKPDEVTIFNSGKNVCNGCYKYANDLKLAIEECSFPIRVSFLHTKMNMVAHNLAKNKK